MAADMSPPDRGPLAALLYWTGAYIGADIGGAWSNIQSSFGGGNASSVREGLATIEPGTVHTGTRRITIVWVAITDVGRATITV
jgi:hypothetical protein